MLMVSLFNTDLVAYLGPLRSSMQGIKIPEDIFIVGFSNWFMSSFISPYPYDHDQTRVTSWEKPAF